MKLYIPDRGTFNIYHFLIYDITCLRLIKNDDEITHIYIEYSENTRQFFNQNLELSKSGAHIANAQYRINRNINHNHAVEIFHILYPNAIIIENAKLDELPPDHIKLPESEYPNNPYYESYLFLRNSFIPHIISHMKESDTLYPEYIFISRNEDSDRRQILNETELFEKCEVLQKFKKINITDYTLLEQMVLFYNAKFIIAAHGAALINTIFCNKATVIEISSDFLKKIQLFKHIAENFPENIHYEIFFASRHSSPIYGANDGMAENLSIDDHQLFNDFVLQRCK